MLVTTKKLLTDAHRKGYAVGAFNINNLEILQAVVEAAKKRKSPIILATSESSIEYAGFDYLYAMVVAATKQHGVTASLHLDHGKNLDVIKQCINGGWTSVMFDGSTLPYEENVAITREVVSWAKKKGVSVEAELGAIKGKEDYIDVKERDAIFTDPSQARDFVRTTKVDSLAISIGTAHGPFKFFGDSHLDIARLKEIKRLTKKPLVLHGASGISSKVVSTLQKKCSILHDCIRVEGAKGVQDRSIKAAIRGGINKINIDSDLRLAFTAGVREALLEDVEIYDPRKLLGPARDLMQSIVEQKLTLFGSAGRLK